MTSLAPGRQLLVLSSADCWALLATRTFGRVAATLHALPTIVPVNYALDDQAVWIRTGRDGELARSLRDSVLALEVDDVDPHTRTGWSVVAIGKATTMPVADLPAGHRAPLPWAPGEHDVLMRIDIGKITGRVLT